MSLLEFDQVSKVYRPGTRERVALRNVSFRLEAGEHVVVWGERHSGRSTLLLIAAGVETAYEGVVRFQGRDLNGRDTEQLRSHIGYCRKTFQPVDGRYILDQLVAGQLMRGGSAASARSRVLAALERAGVLPCARLRPADLDSSEAARVVIARALAHQPKLLIIDEPTLGVNLLERDSILSLLHSLAREDIAVLTSAGDASCLTGADRALLMSDGELVGKHEPDELAAVVPLRRSAAR
ncbi:MAG TPA: ATP-binding cassette domain-containing protein [Solirubrobacteraceae bacterium]|jgi:ABC-type multidrug transport system ATPase subunit